MRSVFLLFEEPPARIQILTDAPEPGREGELGRKEIAETYGLKLVGANFFRMHAV